MPDDRIVHVIDDDDAMRQSLAFLLESAHISVHPYDSVAAFLEALPQGAAGCIITDVQILDIDGVELLRRLNDLKRGLPCHRVRADHPLVH